MKIISVFIFSILLASCALIEKVGENPIVADLAIRQAVLIYIDRGETDSEKYERAKDVASVAKKTLSQLEGSPSTTVAGIIEIVDESITWDKLSVKDRALAQDIMFLIQRRLENKADELPSDTLLVVRGILRTTLATAKVLL